MADADFSVKAIISAQTSQFEKGIKNAQSSVNSLSSSISNITNLVKKAFAFTGIAIGTKAMVDFGKSCVQSVNQAIKTFNILDNTVKATGADAWTSIGELENASKALSDSTNYSVTEIQKMQSVLLGFTNITGEAFDGASEAVLDMATVMGMDLTSAVQTIGKALDDPVSGLDSLRRQGFKFTDEQKAELGQLVKNGKQYEAQKIILDTLATSYGGAAKAGQDSFAKQRHAVENFSDAFGAKLIPVMQVFAENNAKMINSLRELIENMDFTPVVNVVTNLSKIFAEAFNTISGYLRNVGEYVSDFISRFNFKPIISILDTLIGVLVEVISKFKEINSQNLEIFDKLKEALIGFSNSEIFQNIVNFINKIIDAVFFLWSEIQDIAGEIRNLIINKIIEIWNKIKELFQNSQNALADSGQDIASWGDLFYDVLNNAFRIFQDFFGMIKALIHGDWTVAWEYAKLTVMRIADNILDVFSTIANAFPDLVNIFLKGWNWIIEQINKARKFFGQDPLDLAGAFESVDLSKSSGLEDKIKETENKIQELTGKSADITIQNLEGVSTKFAGFTQQALGEIGELTEGVETNSEKQKQYFSSTFSSTEKDSDSMYEKFSEWDSKLLEQRLDNLKEWSGEYHEIQLALIEEERKKALEADKNGAETEKINKYYNKQIEKENERSEKAKRKNAKETMNVILGTLSKVAKNTISVFKKIGGTIKSVFSEIGKFIKNMIDLFSKMFEFNPDEALDALLVVEDKILTFFVETLPKLPAFFESALSSILVLVQTLINSINWEDVTNYIKSIVQSIDTYAPQIIQGIGSIFVSILEMLPKVLPDVMKTLGNILTSIGQFFIDNQESITTSLSESIASIIQGLADWISSGGWKTLLDGLLAIQKAIETVVTDNLETLVDTIVSALPDLIQTLIDSIVSASQTFAKLIKPIVKLIIELLKAIIEVAFSDEVIDASLDAIMALIDAIFDDLIPAILELIPKLIVKIGAGIIKNFPKLVKALVQGLIKAFLKTDWWSVIGQIFMGFIDAFKELFGIHSPSTLFEEFGGFMIEGLVNGLKGIAEAVNTILQPIIDLISDVATKLIDGFVALNEVSFKGFTDSITAVSDGVTKLTEVSFEGISDNIKTVNDGLIGITQITFDGLNKGITAVADGVSKITDSVTALVKELGNLIEKAGKAVAALNPLSSGGSSTSTKSTGEKIVDAIGNILTGGLWGLGKGLLGFATGSQSVPKGLALVGEAGPELVNFRGGEQVINANNTQKALQSAGNKTINQNITFNNLQDTSAYAMIQQLKQYNRQMAINGII